MLEYFRHNIIKMIVTGFGTLFNGIWVAKYDANGNELERYKVPISYDPYRDWETASLINGN